MTLACVCSSLEFDSATFPLHPLLASWQTPKLTRTGSGKELGEEGQGICMRQLLLPPQSPEISVAFKTKHLFLVLVRTAGWLQLNQAQLGWGGLGWSGLHVSCPFGTREKKQHLSGALSSHNRGQMLEEVRGSPAQIQHVTWSKQVTTKSSP